VSGRPCERIIDDNMVIWAGATTAYLNLAVHIIDRLAGHDLAGCDGVGARGRPQPRIAAPYFLFIAPKDPGDDKVLKLQTGIEIHLGEPIRIKDMVNEAEMRVRNLNRRFLSATGLALASAICVAADNAHFALNEVRFGVCPFGGGLFRFIGAACWNATMRYSLTAEEFGAAEGAHHERGGLSVALRTRLRLLLHRRSPRKSAVRRRLQCRPRKRKALPMAAGRPPSRIRFRTSSGF
jgi:hypothetical protein